MPIHDRTLTLTRGSEGATLGSRRRARPVRQPARPVVALRKLLGRRKSRRTAPEGQNG